METIKKIKIQVDPDLESLMPQYLLNREVDYQKLKTFIEHKDYAAIKVVSHKIKGHAASYGLAPLSDICKKMEVAAEAQDDSTLATLISDFKSYLNQIEL